MKYKAIVTTKSGYLLGGTRRHVSTVFLSREDAERWSEVIVDTNKELRNFKDDDITVEIVQVVSRRRA